MILAKLIDIYLYIVLMSNNYTKEEAYEILDKLIDYEHNSELSLMVKKVPFKKASNVPEDRPDVLAFKQYIANQLKNTTDIK